MGGSEILAGMRAARDAQKQQLTEQEEYILERYGEDDLASGTILQWGKQFYDDGPVYTYVALKAGKKWYLTGNATQFSWVELFTEIERENAGAIEIYKVETLSEFIVEDEDAE